MYPQGSNYTSLNRKYNLYWETVRKEKENYELVRKALKGQSKVYSCGAGEGTGTQMVAARRFGFEATWVHLEIVILSEIIQTQTNIIWYH